MNLTKIKNLNFYTSANLMKVSACAEMRAWPLAGVQTPAKYVLAGGLPSDKLHMDEQCGQAGPEWAQDKPGTVGWTEDFIWEPKSLVISLDFEPQVSSAKYGSLPKKKKFCWGYITEKQAEMIRWKFFFF